MHLHLIGVSMASSFTGIFLGLVTSGLFMLADATISPLPPQDLITVRIGAIAGLLGAGGSLIVAVGTQALSFYKLYLQQREYDLKQDDRHEDIVNRLGSSIEVSKSLEGELISHRNYAMNTINDMEKQIVAIQGMLDGLTKDLKQTVIDQAEGTRQEIKEVIEKKEQNGVQ